MTGVFHEPSWMPVADFADDQAQPAFRIMINHIPLMRQNPHQRLQQYQGVLSMP